MKSRTHNLDCQPGPGRPRRIEPAVSGNGELALEGHGSRHDHDDDHADDPDGVGPAAGKEAVAAVAPRVRGPVEHGNGGHDRHDEGDEPHEPAALDEEIGFLAAVAHYSCPPRLV